MDKEQDEISQWNKLRVKIKTNYTMSPDWKKAIDLFRTRLNRKYFRPLQTIINERKSEGEGFTILTAQCAIIESLASFRTGEIYNLDKKAGSPNYEYNGSKKMFVSFLESAPIFENNFWQFDAKKNKVPHKDFDATTFYKSVRCGLMHEARTKGNWFINTDRKDPMTAKIFLEKSKGGEKIKILRTILHYRLIDHLDSYLKELSENNSDGEKLRRLFARKLDHLFEKPADAVNFDWWEDK